MLESTLRDLISNQLHKLEEGLTLLDIEKYIPNRLGTRGFIDILAKDSRECWILIEVKRSDAAAREAIHEIQKYVEGVKRHLGARDDEIRTMIVSTEWKELLIPFSRFSYDTSISLTGIKITVDDLNQQIYSEIIDPLPLGSGRVLSPWHEISLYKDSKRLAEGLASYDASCKRKGINDYIMVQMSAPEGLHETNVWNTARNMSSIRNAPEDAFDGILAECFKSMKRLDYIIYFVPQLLTANEYIEIIKKDPKIYEEVSEFIDDLEGDELLSTLQDYMLSSRPKVDRDYFDIGYPAKFQRRLIDQEGWKIEKVHRRGAFSRNKILSDDIIIGEIAGDAGTSGQRLKRLLSLSNKAEFSQFLRDVGECLPNNPVWKDMIRIQMEEAKRDFPSGTVEGSVFSPSTGLFTLLFSLINEDGVLYIPSYHLSVFENDVPVRVYVGELVQADNQEQTPDSFSSVLNKYYGGYVGSLLMTLTWGGYETRDIDILEDIGLIYGTFRCDVNEDEQKFFRFKNGRWSKVEEITPFHEFSEFTKKNERLINIISKKLLPRMRGGINDGSSAENIIEGLLKNPHRKNEAIINAEDCEVCSVPIANEQVITVGLVNDPALSICLCADCTFSYGAELGLADANVFKKEKHGNWKFIGELMVDKITGLPF